MSAGVKLFLIKTFDSINFLIVYVPYSGNLVVFELLQNDENVLLCISSWIISDSTVYFAQNDKIWKMLGNSDPVLVTSTNGGAISIDVHYQRNKIYWLDKQKQARSYLYYYRHCFDVNHLQGCVQWNHRDGNSHKAIV